MNIYCLQISTAIIYIHFNFNQYLLCHNIVQLSQQRMNSPLQEITNHPNNTQTRTTPQHQQLQNVLQLTHQHLHFGPCLPNSIHQRKVGLILKYTHQYHIVISLKIIVEDKQLAQYTDYIFAVRKQSSSEYFDDYRFKATQKGVYNFIVGVKTPESIGKSISGVLVVTVQDYQGSICLDLRQQIKIPKIICIKQLVNEQNLRLIKLSIMANKSKKQIKIIFKYDQEMNFQLQTELLSLGEDNQALQVRPKMIQPNGKGMFMLSLIANYPNQVLTSTSITQRRILTLKIKDTKAYYHFPVEVTFYGGDKKSESGLQ